MIHINYKEYFIFGDFDKNIGIEYFLTKSKANIIIFINILLLILLFKNIRIQFTHAASHFLILSNDIFHTYIALEIFNISLVIILLDLHVSKQYILRYLIINFAAAALILLGIGIIYMEYGYLNNNHNTSFLANIFITIAFLLKMPTNSEIRLCYKHFSHIEFIATISSAAIIYALHPLLTLNKIIAYAVLFYNLYQLIYTENCLDQILILCGINSIFTLLIFNFETFLFFDSIAKFIILRSYRKNNFLFGLIAFALYVDVPIAIYYFLAKIILLQELQLYEILIYCLFKIIILNKSDAILKFFLSRQFNFDKYILLAFILLQISL